MFSKFREAFSFFLYFPALLAVFWPYAMVVFLTVAIVPLFLFWDVSTFDNINAIITGAGSLPTDMTQLVLIPGIFLFGFPILYCEQGGALSSCHFGLYGQMTDAMATPLGMFAWILTATLALGLFGFALYCTKHLLNLSWSAVTKYGLGFLALVVLLYSVFVN